MNGWLDGWNANDCREKTMGKSSLRVCLMQHNANEKPHLNDHTLWSHM